MHPTHKTEIIAEAGTQELFITRVFDAPRTLVFRAFSESDLLVRWMGPRSLSTRIDKLDNRSHGSWRFVHEDPSGHVFGFHGTIHEVTAPERMIRTFEFEGMPERGHVSLECLTRSELPGNRTQLTIQVIYRSVADRDGHVQSGMEVGVVDSHERLDEVLATLVA
ncbi:MAG: SRPBCC family protein [Bacteroidia bacterium]